MNIPTEKLASTCFLENLKNFGSHQTQPEKHNLYKGLVAMAETIEALLQTSRRVEVQLNSIIRGQHK